MLQSPGSGGLLETCCKVCEWSCTRVVRQSVLVVYCLMSCTIIVHARELAGGNGGGGNGEGRRWEGGFR